MTVQGTLNKALSVITNSAVETIGAGRTDTGVHAREMYAHLDLPFEVENESIIYKLNSFLPNDISISDIFQVHDDAHARFDAKLRTYEYHINTQKDAFVSDTSWYFSQPLNIEAMNKAAEKLLEHTNFECFSKVGTDVNTFNCKIDKAIWTRSGDRLTFTISADRFLRNMVRAIVGTLVNVGLKKTTLTEFIEIIESRDRGKAGFSVPAHGLFLTKIKYDYINEAHSPDSSGILFPEVARNEATAGKRYSG